MSNDTHLLTEDTIESADTIRMPRPLYKVYRVFISKRTGIGLILAYTGYNYWVFRGKVTADTGYHH